MAITYGNNTGVNALDVAFSIHADVDKQFYDVEYPDKEWYQIVDKAQIKTDVNPGATSYSYITRDRKGSAAFINNGGNNNIPMVAQTIGAVQVPVAYAAVGAEITQEDARQYAFGMNGDLAADLGETMRDAMDNLLESTVVFGDSNLGFEGWINYTGVNVQTAAAGASGQTTWTSKTAQEIVNDINTALATVWTDSKNIFKPLDVFIPMKQFAILAETPMVINGTGLAQTALEYISKNNIMYRVTGQELRVHPSRYLEGAGTAGGDRMVIMDRSEKNQVLPMPLPYNLSQPVPEALGAKWYAEAKFGSYHVRQAGSMLYVDGI